MNYIDTYFRMGMYPSPVGLPFVSGNEGAGEVIAVGPGVTDLKVGDRVGYVTALGGSGARGALATAQALKAEATPQVASRPAPEGALAEVQWSQAEVRAAAAERRAEAKAKGYEGEMCGECGNFTLVRNGTCMKCDTCGSTTGCS